MTGGSRPSHIARAALEAIAWRVADILAVVSRQVPPATLRVDGGLTRDPLLMQMQADTAGVSVEHGVVDATAAGAAALAAVGAGIWPSTQAIAERIPVGDRVEPREDDDWRRREHAAWREFVEKAVEL
jgi:glycerol kinase